MSNELRIPVTSGLTIYAQIRNSSAQVWNGTSFETYAAGNWSTYDIAMTEQTSSGIYYGNFPTGITTGGTYQAFFFIQSGGSPATGDTPAGQQSIDWTGTAAVSSATGAMSGSDWYDYLLRRGFKRSDKSTEVYELTTDVIQEMRRRFMFDEAETEATTTDTIGTLGDFKIDIEDDLGLLLGVVLEDDDIGTPLIKATKKEFDSLYPSVNIETDRGYPKHYCVYAQQIYIGPIPDSVSYVYRLSYSRRAGTITSSTTGVPFTNLYRDILADGVLERLYTDLEDYDKAGVHRGRFENGLALAIRRERMNSGAGMFHVKPTNF